MHTIKIYRGDQTIDVLQSASFEIMRREDQLEAARLTGNLTAILRIADLRVGDELETDLTLRSNDPTLGNKVAGILVLGANPPPGRFGLNLVWDNGLEPNLKISPDLASVAKRGDRSVRLAFDNPRSLSPPKDAPPKYAWQRIVEYSRFADWAAVSRYFAPIYRAASQTKPGSPLRTEVRRIADGNPLALDKARAALKLVQQDVRYIYVGLNGGNLTPATADDTWQRRYGDCKGKTTLLLALLNELGIAAEPVLVNTSGNDDGFVDRLPNPGLFDHVIVRAFIDGNQYWLDGTLPPVAPPSRQPFLPYRSVLPLTAQGGALEQLKWQAPKRPQELVTLDLDARAGFAEPVKVTNTSITRGVKGLQQQSELSALSADQILTGFRQQLIGETWRTIDSVRWTYDQENEASVLTIKGTWVLDWTDDGNGAKSYALPGGGFSPPDRRGRSDDQDQSAPYYKKPQYDCYVTTLRLPSSTKASQWYTKSEYDNHIFGVEYYRAFEIKDDTIRMIRGFQVEKPEIDTAVANRDNARLPGFDNSMAWVNFDPKGNFKVTTRASVVPTSYDINWAASDHACLP